MPPKSYKNEKEKVPVQFYSAVHYWLKKKYGVANKCEGKSCKGISVKFQWAKIVGKEYDFKRRNFIQLCRSCHTRQDFTELTIARMREVNPHTHQTHCKEGHEFTEENTYYHNKIKKIHRSCLICKKKNHQKHRGKWEKKNPDKDRAYKRNWWRRKHSVKENRYRRGYRPTPSII